MLIVFSKTAWCDDGFIIYTIGNIKHIFLVSAKKDLILDSQHPAGFEKIQYLEDSSKYKKSEYIDEVVNIKPRFLTKPKSLENMREGQHAHFECKLEPVTDSNLKVEWYKNGRPITVGKCRSSYKIYLQILCSVKY